MEIHIPESIKALLMAWQQQVEDGQKAAVSMKLLVQGLCQLQNVPAGHKADLDIAAGVIRVREIDNA